MSSQSPKVILGTGFFGNVEPWISDKDLSATYDLVSRYSITSLDTAQLYGESEKRLGETKAGERFKVATKWLSGWSPGSATKDGIIKGAQESVRKIACKVCYNKCSRPGRDQGKTSNR